MNNLRLALRMLARDWRAGELTVLGIALVLAVAALTSVAFLGDRVEQALKLESHQLLGGDLLLTADHPWDAAFAGEARSRGLRVAESATFPSMVSAGGQSQLAEIKAVSTGYPLRGTLRVAPSLHAADGVTRVVPERGEGWPDERLAAALGDVSAAEPFDLGAIRLRPGPVLTLEPDRGMNVLALAPRLMIRIEDLPATGLIQQGSRVAWRLHFAGEPAAVSDFERWAASRLGRGEKLESLDNARPEIRNLIERAQRFLRLAALLAVVLAAVAVALAAERYLRRHLDGCAVMRCLGARQNQLVVIHGGEFLLFGLAATLAGCGLGFAVQLAMQQLLGGLLAVSLPPPSPLPWLHGLLVGVVLLAGFALPPLLRLKRVSTLRVLRREWDAGPASRLGYTAGALALAALMLWMAGDLRLGLVVLAGFALAIGLFWLAAQAALHMLRRLRGLGGRVGYGWRQGIAGLGRHRAATAVQIVALALGLTALLLLTVARGDLLANWRSRVPPDAPNRFLINVQPDQRAAIADFFRAAGLPPPPLEPMVRGRLVHVNEKAVTPRDYDDERAQRLVDREFNLSWAERVPAGNTVSAGRWHGRGGREFSVEAGLAETLGLRLGDRLTYEIAGRRVEATITSLRKLDWDSMRVNFFVLAPPGVLEPYPASFISSFHLPAERVAFTNELVRRFPNLTVIDVATLVKQVQSTLDQVARAVQLVFGFAVLAGLAVLYAALQAAGDARRHELAVMKALGARQRQLAAALAAEFAVLGAVAGLLAGIAAGGIGWGLARFAFRLDYLPSPLTPLTGIAAGLVIVLLAGWSGSRGLLRQPALPALRAA